MKPTPVKGLADALYIEVDPQNDKQKVLQASKRRFVDGYLPSRTCSTPKTSKKSKKAGRP